MKKQAEKKIIPLDWIDDSSQYALIPGHENLKKIRRIKSMSRAKGNCYFTRGISKGLIDFIYRAVTKLGLKETKFLFSRGSVKKNGRPVNNAVGIYRLEWDVGISIRIPQRLNYNHTIRLRVAKKNYDLRLMEIIVLTAILHFAYPSKSGDWCSDMAASVIALGWNRLYKGPASVIKK